MEKIKKQLEEREKYLTCLKEEKKKALLSAPEGHLRIGGRKNKVQYYHRNSSSDPNGTYIKEKDSQTAKELAQKEYDKKVLRAAENELSAIKKYQASFQNINVEQIYEQLREERQKLVRPVRETDAQYVSKWMSVTYQGKKFVESIPEYYTARGERVRSKSEVIIADMLEREGIPYRYEYLIQLKGIGKVHPDFTVLNVRQRKELYWEHFGRMDDETYTEYAIQKIRAYEQNGIFPGEKLILTYETSKNPLNQKQILMLIQHYLK